jgi:type II secretory pathway component PulL
MNIIHYSRSGEFSTPLSRERKNTVIAIDSSLVSTHQITLPKMSNAKAHKAIPFALEPQLLDDINLLKFFPIQQNKSLTWEVLVISKKIISELLQQLNEHHIEAASIIPNFMLLPHVFNKVAYYEDNGIIIYRDNYLQGGSLPVDVFNTLYQDKDQLVSSKLNTNPSIKFSLFSSNNNHWKKHLAPWKIPAVLATALFLFSLAQTIVINNALDTQLAQLSVNNEKTFRMLFPEVKRLVNLRIQAEQKLTKAKALKANYSNDLLSQLSAQSSTTVQASKVTLKREKLTIEALK